ncbi:MAG: AMP-binding protein [Alicyclobacillaceae bacterium]|jgi:acyl-CoA synthetase (AMP-forming)/AMP-acid ligase II|nr:AMP-binding protein [Alicyclobacillaceae bacterium]
MSSIHASESIQHWNNETCHSRETILSRIDTVAAATPERTAIVDLLPKGEAWQLSYASLVDKSYRVAEQLLARDIQPGEAVCYQWPTGWEFIALTLGIWRIGALPCPILPSLREREVSYIVEQSGSRLLAVPDSFRNFDYRPLAENIAATVPQTLEICILPMDNRHPEKSNLGTLMADSYNKSAIDARSPDRDALAELLFTSGTTGAPKGALHTHGTLLAALMHHTQTLALTDADSVYVPSPLAHQTGFLYGMMVSLYLGSTGIYQAIWDTETARRAIEQHGARFVQAAMPFLADLVRQNTPPQGLRTFVATGAAIPRALAERASSLLACQVVGGWGSTEACLVAVGRPSDPAQSLWGTDGRVMDGMQMRVVDDAGREVPAGVEGNFQVKTPAMFVDYLHRHDLYAAGFTEDGFFDTGDLATIDSAGFLHLTGRKKDVINRGGEKIPVAELEDILYQHPAVVDMALVAMPDERLGERACAYVVVQAGQSLSLQDLTDFLESRGVAKIYWPERVECVSELPRTASGKVQKYILRQDIAGKLQEEQTVGPTSEVQH